MRLIPNISRKMLSEHLKDLERVQLIVRTAFDPKLQHVEYALSPLGISLMPVLIRLQDWGLSNLPNVLSINEMIAATESRVAK